MLDKPIVVTKVSCKVVWNERWSSVLACECETEEYRHTVFALQREQLNH